MDSSRRPDSRNLNSTYQYKANSTISLNDTISLGGSQQAANSQVNCDIAYSKYLQAVFMKKHTEKLVKSNINTLYDQLCITNEVIYSQKQKQKQLETTIKNLEVKKDLQVSVLELDQRIQQCVSILKEIKINEALDEMIDILTEASSRIYLRGVDVLKDQNQYDDFQKVYEKCSKLVDKVTHTDVENIEKLLELIRICQNSCEHINNKEATYASLQKHVTNAFYRNLSDKFVTHAESQKENM